MKRICQRLVSLALCLLMWGLLATLAQACPTCKDGLAQGPHANIVRGYFFSILLMMSMPFLILSGLVTYGYLLVRRARREQGSRDLPGTVVQGAGASS